jgi:two-component system CheB/CheR fusion protein
MDPPDDALRVQHGGDGLPSIAPDFTEEALQDDIDNIIPTRGYQMTPMVALGGSAGSVQALAEFFNAMRCKTC